MHVAFFENLFVQSVTTCVRADERERGERRFLHDVAEFARQAHVALAFHDGGFYRKRYAADRRPGEPDRRADFRLFFHFVFNKPRRAEIFFRRLFGNGNFHAFFDVRRRYRDFAAYGAYGAFQRAHARFHSVPFDDFFNRAVRKACVLFRKSVGFQLFGD